MFVDRNLMVAARVQVNVSNILTTASWTLVNKSFITELEKINKRAHVNGIGINLCIYRFTR